MDILIFSAAGMVGQGVFRECLLAGDVERVQTVGRTPVGQASLKLLNLVHEDLFNYAAVESELAKL